MSCQCVAGNGILFTEGRKQNYGSDKNRDVFQRAEERKGSYAGTACGKAAGIPANGIKMGNGKQHA